MIICGKVGKVYYLKLGSKDILYMSGTKLEYYTSTDFTVSFKVLYKSGAIIEITQYGKKSVENKSTPSVRELYYIHKYMVSKTFLGILIFKAIIKIKKLDMSLIQVIIKK